VAGKGSGLILPPRRPSSSTQEGEREGGEKYVLAIKEEQPPQVVKEKRGVNEVFRLEEKRLRWFRFVLAGREEKRNTFTTRILKGGSL